MLNPFPSLLMYSFFVPLLLRVTVSVYFVYIAQSMIRNRKNIEATRLPLVGKPKEWMVYASAVVTLLIAFLLFVGMKTQWGAIFAIIICLKQAFILKRFPSLRPFTTATYVLLAVVSFALLISGAGALAFDLPL